MRTITIEELEIKVEASVDNVMPQIKKMTKDVKTEIKKSEKDIQKIGKSVAGAFVGFANSSDAGNISGLKINGKESKIRTLNGTKKSNGNYKANKSVLNDYRGVQNTNIVQPVQQATTEITKATTQLQQAETIVPRLRVAFTKYKKEVQSATKQEELLKIKITELQTKLAQLKAVPITSKNFNNKEIIKTEADIERLTQQYGKLKTKQSDSNNEGKKFEKTNSMFKKGINTIKRYALALFSIRGVYALISRASNAYLSFDTKLSKKIQNTWTGLGALLAPIIEYIANIALKAVAYINAFVKALTGVDYVARANAKALKAQAEAQKQANGGADFDEVHNIQEDTGASSGSGISQIELPDVDTAKVTEFANKVKEIWQWLKDNKDMLIEIGAAIAVVFGTIKIIEFISSLSEISGLLVSITGLGFWQLFAGIGLILAGIVLIVKGVMDFIENPTWQNFLTILQGIALVVAGIAILCGGWVVALIALGVAIVVWVIKNWDKVKEILGVVGQWIYDNVIKPVADFFVGLWDGIVNKATEVWEGIKKVFGAVGNWFKDTFSKAWNGVKNIFSTGGKIFDGIKDGILNGFKTVVNGIIRAINRVIKIPFDGINTALNGIKSVEIAGYKPFSWLPTINTPQIPELARGGVLYNDTVIRAGEYSGARNNPEIVTPQNVMYDTMSKALKDNSRNNNIQVNGEAELKINGKTLAKATIFDFDAEARRLGYKPILQN